MPLELVMSKLGDASFLAGQALAFLVLIATIVTSFTPNRSASRHIDQVLKMLNLLAGNVGRNRNADDA
ncbi:MAG: hypothetical protein JJ879_14780 [Sneathiella sp.]|nr:hypothetical protein [Sneathiella sp.]